MTIRKATWNRALSVILILVMIVSFMAPLVMAVGLNDDGNRRYICGMDEHRHSDECYATSEVWTCQAEFEGMSGRVLHAHDEFCYDSESGELVCYLSETQAHQHNESCYPSEPDGGVVNPDGFTPGDGTVFDDGDEGDVVIPGQTVEPGTGSSEDLTGTQAPDADAVGDETLGDVFGDVSDAEDSGESTVFDDDVSASQFDELALDLVTTCGLEDTTDWVSHQHDESCREVAQGALVCELPEHEHEDSCVVYLMSDEDVATFVASVNELCDDIEAGKYADDSSARDERVAQLQEILAGFEYLTETQALEINEVMARLTEVLEFDGDQNILINSAQFTPRLVTRSVTGLDVGECTFRLTFPDDSTVSLVDGTPKKWADLTATAPGEFEFPEVRFTAPGAYEFKLAQTSASWRCADEWTLTVTVTESGGTLSATGVYKLDDSDVTKNDGFEIRAVQSESYGWKLSTVRQAEKIMSEMSQEEKVGQLILMHYPGDGSGTAAQARELIDKYHLGGYLVFAAMFNNATPASVREKIADAQAASKIPMLFTVDEEGGKVVRISDKTAFRSSKFLGPQDVTAQGGASAVRADAAEKARFLKDLGLNINHAPVADVASTGYIYARTYGGDGVYNAPLVAAAVEGHESVQVGSTMKHFPGYGSTLSNTHDGFAVNYLSLADFEYNDLLPFYAGMASGSRAVMATHNTVNAFNSNEPSSLAPEVYSYLREVMRFDGVAMTDDLGMKAITDHVGAGNAALRALQAGVDIAMTPSTADIDTVFAAARSGELSASEIDAKCRRVLCWKIELGLIDPESVDPGPEEPDPVDPGEREADWTARDGSETCEGSFEYVWSVAAERGGTVKLVEDCAFEEPVRVPKNVQVTLDLNQHTLTYAGTGDAVEVLGILLLTDSAANIATRSYASEVELASEVSAEFIRAVGLNSDGSYEIREADLSGVGRFEASGVSSLVAIRESGSVTIKNGVFTNPNGVTAFAVDGQAQFSMTDGAIVNSGSAASKGGAVMSLNGVNVSGGWFAGNVASQGGAVYVANGSAYVENCVVTCNRATQGGGLYVVGGSVVDGFLTNNHATTGGGAYASRGTLTVRGDGSYVSLNDASGDGGGLYAAGFVRFMQGTKLGGNVADNGGGVYGDGEFSSAILYLNQATNGGGLYANGSRVVASNVSFERNVAENGAGVYVASCSVELTNVTISDNRAAKDGGGMYVCLPKNVSGHTVSLNKVTIRGNSAVGNGGGVCYLRGNIIATDGLTIMGNTRVSPDELALLDYDDVEVTVDCCSDCACEHCAGGEAIETPENPGGGGDVESGEIIGGVEIGGEEVAPEEGEEIELPNPGGDTGDDGDVGGLPNLSAQCSCHEGVKCCDECTCEVVSIVKLDPDPDPEPEFDPLYKYGDEIPSSGTASNLYLGENQTIKIDGVWYDGVRVGVSLERYPDVTKGLVPIAEPKADNVITSYSYMFVPDNENYRTMAYQDYVVVGSSQYGGQTVEGDFDILFQYWADVYSPDTVNPTDDESRGLKMINTEGKNLPKNGDMNHPVRLMFVGEDDRIAMHAVLSRIYADVECNSTTGFVSIPDLHSMNRIAQTDVGYYDVRELWVSDSRGSVDTADSTGWTIYPYSEDLYLTQDSTDVSPNAVKIGEQAVVRFVCSSDEGSFDAKTNFYDYDISDGMIYATSDLTSGLPVSSQTKNRTWYMSVDHKGINSDINYASWGSRLMFGNSNVGTGGAAIVGVDGYLINAANSASNKGHYQTKGESLGDCAFGIVTGMTGSDVVYSSGIVAPSLFGGGDAEGKTVVPGHSLRFGRLGDTYTLQSVTGTSLTNLDKFWNRWNWNKTRRLWSNNFWPMDAAPTWGADGHDMLFGDNSLANNRWFEGVAGPKSPVNGAFSPSHSATLPVTDDGPDHNAYFGMNFELTFRLDEDYVAPLAYYFFGDDDMWVFLDGKLVCDIGGVHGSVGEYVNLRDYLPVGDPATPGEHTLSFFYTERGASGSTCWMQFQLPHPLVVSTDEPPEENLEYGNAKIIKRVSGVETTDETFAMRVVLKDQNGVELFKKYKMVSNLDEAGVEREVASGDVVYLKADEGLTIYALPLNSVVTVEEILTEEQAESWTPDASGVGVITITKAENEVVIHNVYYIEPEGGPALPATGGPGLFLVHALGCWSVTGAAGVGLVRLRRRGDETAE